MTDAGLAELDLRKTKATAAGVKRLRKALPKCRVTRDDGGAEPKK